MQKLDSNLKLIKFFHQLVKPKIFNKIYINFVLYINSLTPKKIFVFINNNKKMGSNKNKPEIYLNNT